MEYVRPARKDFLAWILEAISGKKGDFRTRMLELLHEQYHQGFLRSLLAERALARQVRKLERVIRARANRSHEEMLDIVSLAILEPSVFLKVASHVPVVDGNCTLAVRVKARALQVIIDRLYARQHAGHDHHGNESNAHESKPVLWQASDDGLLTCVEILERARQIRETEPEAAMFAFGAAFLTSQNAGFRQRIRMEARRLGHGSRQMLSLFHLFFGEDFVGGGCDNHRRSI